MSSSRSSWQQNTTNHWSETHGLTSQDSTISKMQHQYWVTKQTVFRKLGKKEDECIVSSDAELDAKLELFKSIQESCADLLNIIEKYQERICTLAQEENAMGRFLKESGKNDKTRAGEMMNCVGKALSYSGQQRINLRMPLLRLFQEVDTFRQRAIEDTLLNIQAMEKVRTEYRASLSWMKNISQELDPDTYKQLEKFKKVQEHVKRSKMRFDRMKLDCLQKIDLLAAARCNMFSHALILYQSSLLQFTEKSVNTFSTIADSFKGHQHYDFCVVKELAELNAASVEPEKDDEKLLEFEDLMADQKRSPDQSTPKTEKELLKADLSKDTSNQLQESQFTSGIADLISTEEATEQSDKLSETDSTTLLTNLFSNMSTSKQNTASSLFLPSQLMQASNQSLFSSVPPSSEKGKEAAASKPSNASFDQNKKPWYDLFAELDPLANPDAIGKTGDQERNC
nr:PREDICTED: islet cell autoantigen 1 [Bemisia tabaci]